MRGRARRWEKNSLTIGLQGTNVGQLIKNDVETSKKKEKVLS